jgi:hypothetical protein
MTQRTENIAISTAVAIVPRERTVNDEVELVFPIL